MGRFDQLSPAVVCFTSHPSLSAAFIIAKGVENIPTGVVSDKVYKTAAYMRELGY